MKPYPKPPPREKRPRARMRSSPTPQLASSRRVYAAARELAWIRDGGLCVICGRAGEQSHHRRPRGAGGSSRRPEVNGAGRLAILCSTCHSWVESHRAEATALGYLIPMGIEPEAWPIWRFGEWSLLREDGTNQAISASEAARLMGA